MRILEPVFHQLAVKFEVLFPHLDERQRRLMMGAEARILGHGGIRALARAARVSETTVRKGVHELEAGEEPMNRVRRSPLRWTVKSTRSLAAALTRQGHRVSAHTPDRHSYRLMACPTH